MANLWRDSLSMGSVGGIRARYDDSADIGVSSTYHSSGGRTDAYLSLSLGSYLERQGLGNKATLIVGTAFFFFANPSSPATILQFYDGGTVQMSVKRNNNGTLSLYRGTSTLLATSDSVTEAIPNSTWFNLEVKIKFHGSTGTYEVKINEVQWATLTATGQNTISSANAYANRVRWYCEAITGNAYDLDDMWINDDTGSAPDNDFWGNVKIPARFPSGDGAYTDGVRGGADSGSDFGQVDEVPHNSDTDYLKFSAVSEKNSFTYADLGVTPSLIYGVSMCGVMRKEDTLDREAAFFVKSGATEHVGANNVLTTSYAFYYENYPENPDTADPWTYTEADAAEFGVEATV